MMTNSKEQGSGRKGNEEKRLLRLFMVVGKEMTAEQLKEHFDTFGTVQYVNLVRDRATKEPKGFAYVKFYRLVRLPLFLPPLAPPFPLLVPPSSFLLLPLPPPSSSSLLLPPTPLGARCKGF